MKIKCENVVRCGNSSCYHNEDGYYCGKIVVALDVEGKCAFYRPKLKPKANPNPNSNKDPLEGSNAC